MEIKNESTLPEFEVKVLDSKDLLLVTGGLMCTNNTKSICDKDGTDDSD